MYWHAACWFFTVVDPADWPDVDSQPLSLEDSWRLRVTSARVYSIVKNRDTEHFERVMGFMETTYRLLPRLVAPIKHMKIMFGLKTMVRRSHVKSVCFYMFQLQLIHDCMSLFIFLHFNVSFCLSPSRSLCGCSGKAEEWLILCLKSISSSPVNYLSTKISVWV